MAKFVITKQTTAADLKAQFAEEFGGTLRVYEGRSETADTTKLVTIGATVGELECRASRTVGSFINAFMETFNLKVKVYTVDNWVAVLDGITLATVKDIPRQATKSSMEQFLGYQREEAPAKDDKQEAEGGYPTYEECVAKFPKTDKSDLFTLSDDGKTLTEISNDFEGPLIIPNGVTEIDAWYDNLEGLTAVIMPDTVKECYTSFCNISNLKFIRLSKKFKDIGSHFGKYCNLGELILPEGVRSISVCAFMNSGITKLQLPNTLGQIMDEAFANNEIEELVIPASVKRICNGAFSGCTKLEKIVFKGNPEIEPGAFEDCPGYKK